MVTTEKSRDAGSVRGTAYSSIHRVGSGRVPQARRTESVVARLRSWLADRIRG